MRIATFEIFCRPDNVLSPYQGITALKEDMYMNIVVGMISFGRCIARYKTVCYSLINSASIRNNGNNYNCMN